MDIKKYKKYEPIYVIGHSNIDIDSAISSKILSDIFNDNGIKSYYAILSSKYDFDEYNKKMLDACIKFDPVIVKKEDINKYNWFLVDHNDRHQSIGMDATVIGSIDHHPNAFNVENVTITDVCSTSLFLYKEFKNEYNFSKEQKYQIYMAFLNDATFGKTSRYKKSDGDLASELGFGNDYARLFKKYFVPTDLSLGINNKIYNGHKKYKFESVYFESGYIEYFGTKGLDEYKKIIEGMDAFLGLWVDYENDHTYAYFKFDNKLKVFDYSFIASRATTILNDVIQYLHEKKYLKD